MDRVNKILQHNKYVKCVKKIKKAEKNRIYCKHNIEHFLEVARIALVLSYEEGYLTGKEEIYAAALLHDIGRFVQYKEGIPHEKASAKLAKSILKECDFSKDEISNIRYAIKNHGNFKIKNAKNLAGLLYRADKISRKCFLCKVEKECNWSKEKKNLRIFI